MGVKFFGGEFKIICFKSRELGFLDSKFFFSEHPYQTLMFTWDRKHFSIRQASTSFTATERALVTMFQKFPYFHLPFTELGQLVEVKWQRKLKSHCLKILLICSCIGLVNCSPKLPMRVSKLWNRVAVLVTVKDFEH